MLAVFFFFFSFAEIEHHTEFRRLDVLSLSDCMSYLFIAYEQTTASGFSSFPFQGRYLYSDDVLNEKDFYFVVEHPSTEAPQDVVAYNWYTKALAYAMADISLYLTNVNVTVGQNMDMVETVGCFVFSFVQKCRVVVPHWAEC